MNIKYFGLGSDLKEIVFEEFRKNEEILYVFENSSSFFEIKREFLKSGKNLFYNFKLLNLYDFYEKLFRTDKIVLKEEKQVILFYNSLTDKIKKELKINGYYDVIDIAYNFYGLFSELQEYKIDYNKIRLEKWQEKTFEILLEINDKIMKKSDEKGLTLPYMLRKSENISKDFIKKYKKICFINKVRFTPLEKEIFEVIEKNGVKVENILQIDKNDFDEEKMKIKDTFGLPDKETFRKKYNVNIEIHEFENKFAQLLGVIKRLHIELEEKKNEENFKKNKVESKEKTVTNLDIISDKTEFRLKQQEYNNKSDKNFKKIEQQKLIETESKENAGLDKAFHEIYNVRKEIQEAANKVKELSGYKIYDTQEETVNNEKDYQLLNQNRITYNLEITMQKTKIYKILNLIYNILESMKTVYRKSYDSKNEVETVFNYENNDIKNEAETVFDDKDNGSKIENLKDFENKIFENKITDIYLKNNNKIYLFRMKELYNAFKSKNFLKIFDLGKSYRLFQQLVSDDYKYISREKLYELSENSEKYSEKKAGINLMIEFISKMEEIYSYRTLDEYRKFLENIFNQSNEKDINIRDKYFEALSEMTVLEDFSFDNLWQDFFGENISPNLLKLFLKYLDKKAISLDLEKIDEQGDEKKYTINSFSSMSETRKENIMFLNLQDTFPKIKVNNYLFSKIQRAKMGLPVSDDEKQIEIFRFYQNILSAKNVYLSYVKNVDEKIDSAGVVEEIKLKYDINSVINEISEQEELNFVKKYFSEYPELAELRKNMEIPKFKELNEINIYSEYDKFVELGEFSENSEPDKKNAEKVNEKTDKKVNEKDTKTVKRKIGKFIKSKLKKDRKKLKEEILSLGFYDFEKIKDFEYGFYIEKMIGETEAENIEDKIDALMFGNIIHILYEKIVMENKEALEKGEFTISDEKIGETFNGILNSFEYKIPKEYMVFYRKISFVEIVKSAKKFLKELSEYLLSERNVKIHSEEKIKNKSEKEIYENVRISGIVDLHIETDTEEILVDYKSGKSNDRNEVRAFNQLDYYSAILEGNRNKILRKWVINTWEGKKSTDEERKEKDILTKENIKQIIKEYYETEFYNLGNEKDAYFSRKYEDIARKEDELNDD